MSKLPTLLANLENPLFHLEEAEIYSFREAEELIGLEKYSYSLFAIWNSVIINIQRRIENFGIKNFLAILEEKEFFNKEGHKLEDRWLNINEFNLINYAQKLNIINHTTHGLITTLFWMKSNTNIEETKNINKDEIFSLLYLLEKNLFLKEFKSDKRNKESIKTDKSSLKRRKKDKEELINSYSNTHQELLLKSGVKLFNNNLHEKQIEAKLLDEYI